ncbi:MAG: protease inhibitor I42 family protein [Clostridia bacterium]|nr:protease inhibitor I42 family protein [Clostridia bacterium]
MKSVKKTVSLILALIIGGLMFLTFPGCFSAEKYSVDYNGMKESYKGAKDSYREGAHVKIYYDIIATDTDYSFFLDGERINYTYDDNKGFVIEFTMPAHDVKLTMTSENSMEYRPSGDATTLRLDSFDGGGPEYSLKAEDPSILSFEVERDYGNPNHAQMDGSAYTVVYTFTGLKPGKTKLFLEARSPIADNYDAVYEAEVDEDLNVQLSSPEITEIQ